MNIFAHPSGDPARAIGEWGKSSIEFAKSEERDDTYNIKARVWDYSHAADNGWIRAKVEKGAFNKHLKLLREIGRNPIMLVNHDHKNMVGTWEELKTEDGALVSRGFIDTATEYRKDIARLCERKILAGVSVGMKFTDAEYDEESKTFIVKEAELNEVSLCGVPAHEYAKVFSADAAAHFAKRPAAPASVKPAPEEDFGAVLAAFQNYNRAAADLTSSISQGA